MRIRTLILLIFLSTVACGPFVGPSENGVQRNSVGRAGSVSKSDDSEPERTEAEANGAFQSVYTDLAEDTCVDDESSDNEGWSVRSCVGVEGYRLLVSEGDLRQSADVVAPDGKVFKLGIPLIVPNAFSTVGDKAEWRVANDSGKIRPIALIIRYNINADPNNTEKITSYLTVSKISPNAACVTDVVKPAQNANADARKLADTASGRPCLKKPPG